MKHFLLLIFSLSAVNLAAQSIVGQWKTIDDNSGEARSVVEIYERDGQYFGKVLKTFPQPGEDADPICDECGDHRKGKKIIGMEIITDMKYNQKGNQYEKGEILDPENGNIYDCKLWIEDETLKVRGYLLFFYRTQTWFRYEGE